METRPIIHAMIAIFLALGEAAGERTLQRAGVLIRDLLADGVVSPEAAEILETALEGVDYDAPRIQILPADWDSIQSVQLAATEH
jgi:hypothetical protein